MASMQTISTERLRAAESRLRGAAAKAGEAGKPMQDWKCSVKANEIDGELRRRAGAADVFDGIYSIWLDARK